MRHKRILDVAAANPDASLEAIAAEIPSATIDLVERVLDEHGDPGTGAIDEILEPTTDHDPDDLTDIQLETLRTIADHPDATQRELGELLGVSSATINTRVNGIPGFDWEHRHAFIERALPPATDDPPSKPAAHETDVAAAIDKLDARLSALEDRVPDTPTTADTGCFTEADLAHKVAHACMQSETISQAEEVRIFAALFDESAD